MPILPSENRAVLQSLEQAENIPSGLLQGLYEKRTGWRPNLNFLPDYMLPEEDRGENKTEQEVMAQDLTGAKMLRMTLDVFGGNEALASHAFLFGTDKTEARINDGKFPQAEADSVFDVAKRKAGILGEQVLPEQVDQFASMLGTKPSEKVINQKQPPRPEPQQPVSLKKSQDGTYYTGNPLYDDFLQSDNIATDKDPEAAFLNLKRKLRGYEQALTKAGIPINADTLRLAHDKGVGTAIKAWNTASSAPTEPMLSEVMADDGMAAVSGQPLAMSAEMPPASLEAPQLGALPQPVAAPPIDNAPPDLPVAVSDEDWSAIADRVFGSKEKTYANKAVNKAIHGLLTGIV